jgi:hypothetical protein
MALQGVKKWRNKKNSFFVYQMHYTADPAKRSETWKAAQSAGIPANDWNREYEIDFSSFLGKPVFLHDYDDARMYVPVEPSPKFPLIRTWDFGYHHPAVSWCQFIDGVQFVVLQSDLGSDVDFRLYVRNILTSSSIYFPGRKFVDCCDRAGDFERPTGDSEVRILRNEFGINPIYRYFKIEHTLDLMRKLMNSTYKKQPCFLVNDTPSNHLLRDALRGGYHYDEQVQGRAEKELPSNDGYYENIIDPIRYAIANFHGTSGIQFQRQLEIISTIDIPAEKEAI